MARPSSGFSLVVGLFDAHTVGPLLLPTSLANYPEDRSERQRLEAFSIYHSYGSYSGDDPSRESPRALIGLGRLLCAATQGNKQ